MENTVILISGMPATGKSTFGAWPSQKLRAPLVSYDHILAKLTEPAAEAPDAKGHPAFQRIPYEFFFFTLEETMRSSARFLADYIFSDQIAGLLDRLAEKYRYRVINIHLDAAPETAYQRFLQRNTQDRESKEIRPAVSPEDFRSATKQNRDFRYGDCLIEVDTEDFSRLSYDSVYEAVKKHLQE